MKFGRFIVNFLKYTSQKGTNKRRKTYPPISLFEHRLDIPYINDHNREHTFDIFYGDKNKKKKCLIIDIHGGAYIFGDHYDNYPFSFFFTKEGFDIINIGYRINNGKLSIMDQIDDIAKCIEYIFTHKKELNIDYPNMVITGDSAGGHLALLFAELINDSKLANELGYKFSNHDLIAVLTNCTVYDFTNIKDNGLSNSGMKRMFGESYIEVDFTKLCPKTHINSLKAPVFASTCKKDFLRKQSLMLMKDLEDRNHDFEFLDINSDNKHVGHVHNVLNLDIKESKEVNQKMIDFINKHLNN